MTITMRMPVRSSRMAFRPASISLSSGISAGSSVSLLWPHHYPLQHALSGNYYNRAGAVVGLAFPERSRSVLFIGNHGTTANWCYGTGAECNDPCMSQRGEHAYPYQHQIWAYDANDLLD